ncbi:hypothetical protein [Gluconacetobacter johannae]|uniref:Glycosyltransferase n=1 Tax=Gluconacetobacter johannae TaxID=112140 RepID=A0A7W4JA74_9PROT|nr:hypothetical protein [Gluconacetobacter johannae]MBB2177534.1 hypothetical protein [Gluconacetobacter johannae]
MKIALLVRGPIRPNIEAVLSKVRVIKKEIESKFNDIDVFLSTWKEDVLGVNDLLRGNEVENVFFLKKPDAKFVYEYLRTTHLSGGQTAYNVFLQYYMSKVSLDLISSYGNYDFIVHSRTDLSISLGGSLESWFVEGVYKTIHVPGVDSGFINDQFSISDTKTMLSSWNYESLENLRELISNSEIPEHILWNMIVSRNITAEISGYDVWELDPNRHKK